MSAQGNGSAAPPPARRVHQALIDLCFERGFAAVSVEDLCRRAQVDRSCFEGRWSDLEDCFCGVYLEVREDFLDRLRTTVSGLDTWRERLRAVAYFLLDFFAEDPKVTYFGLVEVRGAGERVQLLFSEVFETIFDLLDEGRLERAGGEATISRDTAVAVGSGIFNQIWLAAARGEPITEAAVPQMLYAAVLPYLGPEAAMEELHASPPPFPPTRRR